jgi:hypothetical protein
LRSGFLHCAAHGETVSRFGRNDDFFVGKRRARTTAGPFDKLRAGSSTALRMTDVVMMAKISSNDHRPRGIKHKSAA